jgi:branched-chain amino acid transport system permease protein
MDWPTAVTLALNGLALAAILFLLASGLTLIFGLLDVLNFAHGAFFLVGSYVFVKLLTGGTPMLLALLVAGAIGVVMGFFVEHVLIRRLYGKVLEQFLITLGVGLILTELVQVIWGPDFQPTGDLPILEGTVTVLGGTVQEYRLALILVGVAVFLLMYWILQRTRIGLIVRAGVQDSEMVQALGTNVGRAFAAMFALGAGLAFFAGAAAAPYYSGTAPSLGDEHLVLAFVIAVVGGLGSYVGAAAGAAMVGLVSSYVSYYWSAGASLVPVLLMLLVLVFRPEGLIKGKRSVRV